MNLFKLYQILAFTTSMDRHVIIGTPKEVVSFGLLGVFSLTNLKIIVFDDADTVASTQLVKKIMVANCQKVFISSTHVRLNNVVTMKFMPNNRLLPENIDQFYAKCTTMTEKIQYVKEICRRLQKYKDGKVIIFSNVIL